MRRFFRKPYDFVFDRGAISWSHAFNVTTIHSRKVKVLTNNLMCAFIRVGNSARNLANKRLSIQKRKERGILIARLHFQLAPSDGRSIESRWGARFKAPSGQSDIAQLRRYADKAE